MSRGLNKAMIIGNLGGDPEMRYTPSGKPLTKFQLASNRNWISAEGERKTETEWFTIIAWGKLAEICNQYLTKGQQVYIEGRIQTRSYDDRDGNKRYITEIVADQMQMLGSRDDNQGGGYGGGQGYAQGGQQGTNSAGQQSPQQPQQPQQKQQGGFEEPAFNPDDEIPF